MNIEIVKIKKGDFDFAKETWWDKIYWSSYIFVDKFYWNIHNFFQSQHESIRKAIPNAWRDLDGILEDVLSSIIISYVEEENGLDQIQMILDSLDKDDEYLKNEWGSVDLFWDYYNDRYQDYLRLQSIYTWVKSGRKAMQNYLETIENNWEEYAKVEQDIYDRDTEYLADLVKLRKYLWT
jgi:phosphoglycolate phosphatase-like HAD superfamily hydrolase